MYFWESYDTIPAGVGIEGFGAVHLAWLGFAAALISVSALLYRRAGEKGRKGARLFIASLIWLEEIFKLTVLFVTDNFEPWYLPLHFCSVSMFVVLFHALRPGRLSSQLLYCGGLPGALMALVFPNWLFLPFFNYMHLQSFTIHILLVLYPVMLLSAGELKPEPRLLPKCAAILGGLAVAVYPVNKILHSNFFFLNGPGEGNPLVWFYARLGSPGYFLVGIPVLVGILWTLMYVPPWLARRRFNGGLNES